MKKRVHRCCSFLLLVISFSAFSQTKPVAGAAFVRRVNRQFMVGNMTWYFIGANYWYGAYLPLLPDKQKGLARLQKELDFLQANGITNLRVLAGVEGNGQINGVQRVKPPLQPQQGVFDDAQLKGLDILLYEMDKRHLKAVIFLSNNWEWSGGFLQYLNWNGVLPTADMQRKLNWDELRDYTSKFYSCADCMAAYRNQVAHIINRTNTITGKKYRDDAAIMSWELANEPRPMRPATDSAYKAFISNTAAYIRSLDKNHLITAGTEGDMATDGDLPLYEQVHADKNIDYCTIHIWPKNWGWFKPETLQQDLPSIKDKTAAYIDRHIQVCEELNKPLVIEEFGIPRDGHSFSVTAATTIRDEYYGLYLSKWKEQSMHNGVLAGINFWSFSGSGRPVPGQVFWKEGDDYLGDPPMEEQGLNSVFDSDSTTWRLINSYSNIRVRIK